MWPQPDHLWISRKSRQFLPSQRLSNARASIPAEILARGLSCVSATLQLKREWSLWPEFGRIPGNLCEFSKGYFAPTFLSSSPPTPATQSGVYQPIHERCVAAENTYGLFVP